MYQEEKCESINRPYKDGHLIELHGLLVETQFPEQIYELTSNAINIVKNILSLVNINKLDVYFIKNSTNNEDMGRYVWDSYKNENGPIIGLYMNHLIKKCNDCDLDYFTAIITTIAHEIAHVIQNINNLPKCDEQAENFADSYWFFCYGIDRHMFSQVFPELER